MKILYVITKSNFGGSQRYVFELAVAMKKAGHEVAVASSPKGYLVDKLENENIKHFPIKSFQRDINAKKEIGAITELKKCFKIFAPKVIHLNSSKAGVLGAIAGKWITGRPKLIFTAHGWPFLEKRSWLWKTVAFTGSYITALFVDKVILVSKDGKENTPMPFVKNKLVLVKNAVPEIDFKNRNDARAELFTIDKIQKHQKDIWLVTTAELNHNKNIKTAISAVCEYNKKNTQKIFYTIFGEGELKTELNKFISENKAEAYINLYGYLPEARTFLKAFDVFLMSSLKEGMPYAVIEAGAAGLPVVASKVGGISEIINDRENGLLINPNINQTIIQALEEAAKPNDYGQKLQNNIKAEFGLETMVKETTKVYL